MLMAQFHIRDFPDELVPKVQALADAAGQSREGWLRDLVVNATKQPVVQKRYTIKVYGASGGKGSLRRYDDGPNNVGGGCNNFSDEEFDAYERAKDLVSRNSPGDREKAIGVLQRVFEDVFTEDWV